MYILLWYEYIPYIYSSWLQVLLQYNLLKQILLSIMEIALENTKVKTHKEATLYDFYVRYLLVLNATLPLDAWMNMSQIKMLAVILSLDGDVHKNNPFNGVARKQIRDSLRYSFSTISNNISDLKDKKLVYTDSATGILKLIKAFYIDVSSNAVAVTNIIKLEEVIFEE